MKAVLKRTIFCTAAILFLILNIYNFSAIGKKNIETLLPLAAASQAEDESNDAGSNDFNFIKSNENIKDFLYDGSLLLYGGIGLIAVSVIGIVITFLPRKHRKKRPNKSDSNKRARK